MKVAREIATSGVGGIHSQSQSKGSHYGHKDERTNYPRQESQQGSFHGNHKHQVGYPAHHATSVDSRVHRSNNIQGQNYTKNGWSTRIEETGKRNRPISPAEAIEKYGYCLSPSELEEIKEFDEIYYCGQTAAKSKHDGNYDLPDGEYMVEVHDHIMYRYEILDPLGKGSFGEVRRVYDHQNNEYVALKIIRNQKRFYSQALIEIKILEFMRDENQNGVVQILDFFEFRGHICITFELLSVNLYEVIKANKFEGLSLPFIAIVTQQLIMGLKTLGDSGIIHCDLKPENVMLKSSYTAKLKIIDLGSSCFENEKIYTYIQSRFYRSPEVILGSPFGTGIDMWSLGCMIVEMCTGIPIFPGENELDQLACIIEVLGMPPREMIENCKRRDVFFDANNDFKLKPSTNGSGKVRIPGSVPLASVMANADPYLTDLVARALTWDAADRLQPDDGLMHPFFKRYAKAEMSAFANAAAAMRKNSMINNDIGDLSNSVKNNQMHYHQQQQQQQPQPQVRKNEKRGFLNQNSDQFSKRLSKITGLRQSRKGYPNQGAQKYPPSGYNGRNQVVHLIGSS